MSSIWQNKIKLHIKNYTIMLSFRTVGRVKYLLDFFSIDAPLQFEISPVRKKQYGGNVNISASFQDKQLNLLVKILLTHMHTIYNILIHCSVGKATKYTCIF